LRNPFPGIPGSVLIIANSHKTEKISLILAVAAYKTDRVTKQTKEIWKFKAFDLLAKDFN
jgi:hypothetical protein